MRLEFTTLLRQRKPGYDKYVVKEVKAMKEQSTENRMDYILVGDYYIPDLKLQGEERPIGKYGRMHREYLRENNPVLFNDLVLSCRIWIYLANTNEQA